MYCVNVSLTILYVFAVGRRIINPTCGSAWSGSDTGSHNFVDFIEPGYTNFYAISPNYFFADRENRRVTITRQGAGSGELIICHSRTLQQPR